MTFTYLIVNRWTGLSLDFVCIIFSSCAAVFAILAKDKANVEDLAFILQIITDVVIFFGYSVRMTAELENHMTCSQRIHAYT